MIFLRRPSKVCFVFGTWKGSEEVAIGTQKMQGKGPPTNSSVAESHNILQWKIYFTNFGKNNALLAIVMCAQERRQFSRYLGGK